MVVGTLVGTSNSLIRTHANERGEARFVAFSSNSNQKEE